MQNVASDAISNNEKIDKGSNLQLQELGIVSTPQSFNSSPIKSEFNPSYTKIQSGFLSETSDEEDVDEVEAFVIEQDYLDDESEMDSSKYYLPKDEDSEDQTVDPETQARLEALLEAAGIGKLASGEGALADPEVLRRLTSSVSCALDEAAAALTRMRNENPRPQNERSLVQACSDGDVKTVKKLLTEGRSVNETTDEGESLLSLACSAGYYELAQVLIAMNASVEDRGSKGDCTPLMEAASSGFIDIVRLLINHGANVNGQSSSGNTPLMYACAGGHEAVVGVLLECGANVEDHNENGHTPLMEAASAGHVGVAKILLEYGAGINTHSNEFKESALTLACYKGHLDMVRFLLSAGADQEHKTDEMHTALMEASMDGHVEVAKLLLDSGAQVNMPTDSFESPLTLAACGGHVDLALLLIERGANIEEVNDEGYTPLMEAAREGHEEMVCVLLQKGAKINAHTDETQETALTLACCGNFLEVADFLLKNGADIELGASTPLMEAAQEGHLKLVRYLLQSGAQVHAKTQTGDTALTYACENGHTDVADLLLSHGAILEHESEGGRTPLMKACRAGHLCTVQFLISKSADVNRQTSNNDHTPLSLACAGGHLSVVQLLLAHNADPYHKLKDNSTMLIEAAKGGHTTVVQLLLDYPQSVIGGASVSIPSPTDSSSPPPVNRVESALREKLTNLQKKQEEHQEVHSPQSEEQLSPLRTTSSTFSSNGSASESTNENTNAAFLKEQFQSINLQQLKLLSKQNLQSQELHHKQIDLLKIKNKRHQEINTYAVALPKSNGVDMKPNVNQKLQASVLSKPGQTLTSQQKQAQLPSLQQKQSQQPTAQQKQGQPPLSHQKQAQLTTSHQKQCQQPTSQQKPSQQPTSHQKQVQPPSSHQKESQVKQTQQATPQQKQVQQPIPQQKQMQQATPQQKLAQALTSQQRQAPPACQQKQSQLLTSQQKSQLPTFLQNCEQQQAKSLQKQPLKLPPTSQSNEQPKPQQNANQSFVFSSEKLKQSLQIGPLGRQNPLSDRNTLFLSGKTSFLDVFSEEDKNAASDDKNTTVQPIQIKTLKKVRQSSPNASSDNLSSSEAQQVKNAPSLISVKHSSKLMPDPLKSLENSHVQNTLVELIQSQFLTDHLNKDAKGNCPSDASTISPPISPISPPSGENKTYRPVTPPLPPPTFGADSNSQRPVTQGLVVGNQPLFHPGANTTVVHNTIYTRSVPVPSPADVNQSTAICDRPKAKPVSKKEGKNGKKLQQQQQLQQTHQPQQSQQTPGFHFTVHQQKEKEALQLKQLLEMHEQLTNQVVSQQTQVVLANGNGNVETESTPTATPISVLSTSDIFADSTSRSELLAKEMMEMMSVNQETRDLIDQLETITMEEVERAATQGQKKLLKDKFQYAVGLQDSLKKTKYASDEARVVTAPPTATAPQCGTTLQVVASPGQGENIDTYQYFTVPSPGGGDEQNYFKGFPNLQMQMHYQLSRQKMTEAPKLDTNTTSPFPSATMPLKNGTAECDTDNTAPSSSPYDAYMSSLASNHIQVATQTPVQVSEASSSNKKPNQGLTITPIGQVATQTSSVVVETPNSSKKSGQGITITSIGGFKAKKREARPSNISSTTSASNSNNGCQTNSVDPAQPRVSYTADTPSPGSVTSTASFTGMDVDSETESNHDTALTLACAGGHEELVELLLSRGADIEHRDKKGFTPLILAATAGHDKVVDILLNHQADMEAQSERTKDTPLSLACSGGRYEVVELLLTRGANKEHRNVSDYTPLSLAASGGYVNIIKLLLTHGAEINSRTGSKLGISPLMLAAMNGHTAAVRLLLDMGSDINAQIETNRNTALTLACFQGRHEVVSLLLDRKANVEHRAKTGLTPLMEAASGGYIEVGRVLLDKGADVNAPPVPSSRDTALTIAADKGHCRFVELLLNKGAQIEVKNKKGNSPLWLAANGGHHSVVDLLCTNGADIDSQDNRKVSCLMAAFRKGHVKVVRWMVNHVTQFPSDQEMSRYIQTVINDKELLDKCQECSFVIRVAKNQQAERANKNANILLEELDMEKWREESKRAAQARKRERKKQKKLEKKEEKRKQIQEEEKEEQEVEELDDEDKENVEEEDMNISAGREGEEGDSGIDANSQASCSSNEVKQTTSTKKSRKDKKKKKSASASNVPAKVTNSKNSVGLQRNASTNGMPTTMNTAKQQHDQSNSKITNKNSTDSSNSHNKKEKKKLAPSNQADSCNTTSSVVSNQSPAQQKSLGSVSLNGTAIKESKAKPNKNNNNVLQSSQNEISIKMSVAPAAVSSTVTNSVGTSNSAPIDTNNTGGSKEKRVKEKATTPRKEVQQHLIFESSHHPAEREDFQATGSDSFKDRKRTSLMSLFSDGELIASSSGAKINSSKQPAGGKREEGWKEVVRKYLSTTLRYKKVSVPLNAISRVIGRGGSNINAIRSATNAHIEVEKQCKGQGERIITIKGNNESIKQANSLINALIRDPDVDLQKLLSESGKSPVPTAPAIVKSKPQQIVVPSSVPSTSTVVNMKPNLTSSAVPPLLGSIPGSMTFVKAPIAPPVPQTPALSQGVPAPLIPGLRASAPRATCPRIVAAGGEKRAPRHATAVTSSTMSYTTAIMTTNNSKTSTVSSFAAKLSEPPVSTSSSPPPLPSVAQQSRPLPTASAPPSISAPFQNPPASSPTPPTAMIMPQTQSSGLTEYSLFNDTFTKVTQQSVWGREDDSDADKKGMNFASVAANNNSVLTPTNSSTKYLEPLTPADASLAPGYRGSPVMSKASASPAPPSYQVDTSPPSRPRPTSMYSEDLAPVYQQDLLKMVPGSYLPTSVTMSRLNPRAPDFSSMKASSQPNAHQTQTPMFNSSIPPPVVPFPNQNKYQAQPPPGPPAGWSYMNFNMGQTTQNDMMSHLATLALAHNQAGDLFTNVENTPPSSPLAVGERKVPRPIGTERAWKNYSNISTTPLEENAHWLQQEPKSFGGIGDNRHMFRSSNTPSALQFSRLPIPEEIAAPVHLIDNGYGDAGAHYPMNGATVMLLPPHLDNTFEHPQQLVPQTPFGLTSLMPEGFKPENSWDPTRLCMSDVPISDKQPQVWTTAKWSN